MRIKYKNQKGDFIKHCPCSPQAVSCGYYNLNLHTGCPYDCSYCILQSYLESKNPVFYININEMASELDSFSKSHKKIRIGTGELSDSLAYDVETSYSQKILEVFSSFPNMIFEFKTKSGNITRFMEEKQVLGNIVISWSLNPQLIITREERQTADLKIRLKALRDIQSKGYKIGLHFDPLLLFDNWREHYKELIDLISQYVNPARIAWWSLGALRFPSSLRDHIFKHKNSELFSGELIKGYDGKYRYFKPLRIDLFKFICQSIKHQISGNIPLYLCMEDSEAWQEILPDQEPVEEKINALLFDSAIG